MKHKKVEDFLGMYHESLGASETIANIEFPFSTACLDAAHDFSSAMVPEVRRYCDKELGVFADKVLLFACFLSEDKPAYERVTFDSVVRLSVLKMNSGGHLAVLFLGGEISRK